MMKVLNLKLNTIISIINYLDLIVESTKLKDTIQFAPVVIKSDYPYNK